LEKKNKRKTFYSFIVLTIFALSLSGLASCKLKAEQKSLTSHFEMVDILIADNQFADDYFDGNETQKLLYEAMETLPEAQRATFSLRYFDDMPYSEISKILGTTEGGLKANYHLAVKKIKEFFQQKN
jgi:RNA polymerase sigma-70 factor (ECF subfamily)